uniref:Putative dna polymerase theta n=1 Tax=Culex tarsalis TaxID=7177 RepID=A0A1Q3EVX4_CULTA
MPGVPYRARPSGLPRSVGPPSGWRGPRPPITPLVTTTTIAAAATAGRSVGNTTRDNLMSMDDTLLNAIDLAEIERMSTQQDKQQPADVLFKKPVLSRTSSILQASRFRPLSPATKSPSPKKARPSGPSRYIVLDITQKDSPDGAKSLQDDRLNRKASSPPQTKLSATIPNSRRTLFESRISTPKRKSGNEVAAPSVPTVRKEPTVELFQFDSQVLGDWESQHPGQVDVKEKPREVATKRDEDVNENDDDDYFPSYQEAVDPNCSQLFLEEVDRNGKKPLTQVGTPLRSPEVSSIVKNSATCSQYIRLERSMMEENQANLIDDVVDTQLAREFDSTQQRQQILGVFSEFERTLLDTSNVQIEPPAELDPNLAEINWDEDVTIAGEKPSNRSRLANIFGRSRQESSAGSPKLVARKSAPLISSHFKDMGPFFGLPAQVKHLIAKYRGIKELYDWQKECLGLTAIVERHNLIYALPTSGGKTLVAEILMLREVMLRNRNVMFIVPYVSIAQEKLAALAPFAVDLAFLVEEYSGGKGTIPPRKRKHKNSIFVCTIEKALVLLNGLIEVDRANEVGLIVIDELHMIGEERRGVHLEVLLTKVKAIQAGIQVVGMSATIGNLDEVARFMDADIYCRDFRPVELQEYVKCGSDLFEINTKARTLEDAFKTKQHVEFDYSDDHRRIDPDHVIGMVLDVIPSKSCLLFCPTKRQCEQLCALMVEHLPKELLLYRTKEKEELVIALRAENNSADLLANAFALGIAYHHSGLTFDERKLIEDAYRLGILSLIICTSTLAAGVNLPAKRVIIRSPYVATNFITLSKYKQMAGRAGRAGLGETGESILICQKKDIAAVCNLLCSPMDEAISTLHTDDGNYLKNLALSSIGLGICDTRNDVHKLTSKTLLALQADRLGVDLRELTDKALQILYKEHAIRARSDACKKNPANMTIRFDEADSTQAELPPENGNVPVREVVVTRGVEGTTEAGKLVKKLRKTTRLVINDLGKAAIRAGFHMDKASRFYDEMVRIGERLNVNDQYHLLYLIVMDDDGTVRLTDAELVAFTASLQDDKQLAFARRFHVGEYTIQRVLSSIRIPDDLRTTVSRFFRMKIVSELWDLKPAQNVAHEYKVDAGSVQSLMTNVAATASGLLRMSEEIPELWAYRQLLATMTQRLSHCCTVELLPLMELPGVKISRAKQLWRAGYTSLASIASAKSSDLVTSVEYMTYRAAGQLIMAAKAKLMEQVEELRDRVEDYLQVIR